MVSSLALGCGKNQEWSEPDFARVSAAKEIGLRRLPLCAKKIKKRRRRGLLASFIVPYQLRRES